MQPRLTPQARSLLRKQRFIVATWQGPGCGLSPRAIRSAGRRRDWRRVTNRTYLAIDAEPDPAALRVAGTLELGPAALLSGSAALVEHGWQGDPGSLVDVLMPRGTNLTSRAALPWWLRVHVRRAPSDAPGVVPLAAACEAVLDAASWARTDREAMFILVSALQQRITTAAALERALGRQRRHRIRLMREILAEFRSGATSMGELDLRKECRRRGLPEPIGQRVRRDSEGRIRFIDAEFVAADGVPVLVEIDGTGHFRPETWLGDVRRQRKVLVPDGTRWLRVTTWELRYEPEDFFDDLRRALGIAESDV